MTGKRNRPHHAGDYARRAKAVRDTANANPATTCWRCGKTRAERAAIDGDKAAQWQAGHLVDGQVGGALAAECARCNSSNGARHGNAQREPRTETWW